MEFATRFVECIRFFDTPEQALSAVQKYHVPYKGRRYKKAVKKLIRTYAYITNNKEDNSEEGTA